VVFDSFLFLTMNLVYTAAPQNRRFASLEGGERFSLPGPFFSSTHDFYSLACAAAFFASSSFSCSRLKLAPFCIGGNSRKVCAALATSF